MSRLPDAAPGAPKAPPPLDAVAAETPPPLSLDDPTSAPVATADDPAARRTAELAPLYAAAVATLTWGFRTGAALLAAGIVLALARREPLNREANPFAEVIPAVLDGRAAGVVDLAILWLMVVPVGAVLVVAGGFLRLGDRRYAVISLLVLAVLGISIALALRR